MQRVAPIPSPALQNFLAAAASYRNINALGFQLEEARRAGFSARAERILLHLQSGYVSWRASGGAIEVVA